MTREITIIPTTLVDWARITHLSSAQKLICYFLWGGRYTSCIGVARHISLPTISASLSLEISEIENGLRALETEHLVLWDQEVGEIFVCDWYRFHKFNGIGNAIAQREFCFVLSERIRRALLVLAPWLAAQKLPNLQKINKLPPQQQLQPEHHIEPLTPQQSGGSLLEDPHLANVLADCPFSWREALLAELEIAVGARRIKTTAARWARGTLNNWIAAAKPDSLAMKMLVEEKAHALVRQTAVECEIAKKSLIGHIFRGGSRNWVARERHDGSVVLENSANEVIFVNSEVLADIQAGKLVRVD